MFGLVEFLFVLLIGLTLPLPLGIPPQKEDPTLVRAVPKDSLAFVQWFGIATPDAKATNRAERFAAHPEIRALFVHLERAALDWCAAQEKEWQAAQVPVAPLEVFGLLRAAWNSQGVVYLESFTPDGDPRGVKAGLLVHLPAAAGQAGPAQRMYETLKSIQARVARAAARDGDPSPGQDLPVAGGAARRFDLGPRMPALVYGHRGDHLFATLGEGTHERLLAALAAQDGVGATPRFAGLRAKAQVERPVVRVYCDAEGLLRLAAAGLDEGEQRFVEAFGLDSARGILVENGLEGEGVCARTFLAAEGKPRGIFRALAQKPLAAEDLAPIPADATLALALRMESEALLDEVLQGAARVDPELRRAMESELLGAAGELLGVRLREDLLAGLGDVVTLWNAPSQGGLWFTGLTLAVPLRDPPRVARALETVLQRLRATMPPRAARAELRARYGFLEAAQQDLQMLHWGVQQWRSDHDGKLPKIEELDRSNLREAARGEEGKPPVDPWGHPYRLVVAEGQEYRVVSDGADGRPDTDDDLDQNNVWERAQAASPYASSLEQASFLDQTIHYVNPGQSAFFPLAWSLTPGHLLISLDPATLKASLLHLQAKDRDLASVPAVRAALGSSAILVQDTAGLFPFAYGIGKLIAAPLCAQLQREGFDLTVDALPSAAAFREVLGHDVHSLRAVEGGYVLEKRGRMPDLLGALPFVPAFLFLARSF